MVSDPDRQVAAIIDPVLYYDSATRRTSTASAERLLDHVRRENLRIEWILETHAHADHLTSAQWLKARLPGSRVGITWRSARFNRPSSPDLNSKSIS
ncbi:MAG: MBL fold metallo-hydrolase [Gammaproteobacteria bacterium]|nr:MBL fold metallo-hydrolase [Gammaproteobacteria bacterium]